jgi:hypothetical protein
MANPVPPAAQHDKVISSRQEISSVSPLDCFGLVHGETIRVETHYWDPADPPPPAPAGEAHLGDRLDAPP